MNVNVQAKKSPGRKRRATGWTLLAFGLLVAGVWVWSGRYDYGRDTAGGWWHIHAGEINAVWYDPEGYVDPNGYRSERPTIIIPVDGPSWRWTFSRRAFSVTATDGYVGLSFWSLPLLLWTPAALLLRSGIVARRRANTNACGKCGYSLAGLGDDAKCPECGKVRVS